jgi:hypothetical protein
LHQKEFTPAVKADDDVCVGRPLRKQQVIVVKWNPPYCTQSQLEFVSSLSHYQTTTVA